MDSPNRIAAGVAYTLSQLADEGHVYAPETSSFKMQQNCWA